MLELDLLLNRFIDTSYAALDKQQLQIFVRLLDYPDQLLHDLLISGTPSSDAEITHLVDYILEQNRALLANQTTE